VTSAGDSPGPDQVDPAYEALFRPASPEPPAASAPEPEPAAVESAEPEAPAASQPAAAATPDRQPNSDTGRLFRSQGVTDRPDTVLALESGRFTRLRTLERGDTAPNADPSDMAVAALLVEPAPEPTSGDPMPPRETSASATRRERRSTSARTSGRGASGIIVSGVVIAITVIIGFANAALGGGSLGWPTGLALLVSSIYGAMAIRRADDTIAFLIPPVAFLVAALTAGQLFLDSGEGSLLNRGVIVFFSLADNWLWILGSTLVALVIVLVRRRRS
jgi:hypothetical protein